MSTEDPQVNPSKVRAGLIVIAVLFVVSLVLLAVVNDPVGRAIFFAVAVMALIRIALLVRWIKRRPGSGDPSDRT